MQPSLNNFPTARLHLVANLPPYENKLARCAFHVSPEPGDDEPPYQTR